MPDLLAKAASKSINRTIDEIEKMLEGQALPPAGALRQQLRAQLEEALTKVAKEWLEHGFHGGHIITAKRFAEEGEFPTTIEASVERRFPVRSVSPTTERLSLSSELPEDVVEMLKQVA